MTKPLSNYNSRCPVCLFEFNMESMAKMGVKGCPHCKTQLQMLGMNQDGYFKANWQDIRVLAIYARRWAAMFDMTNQGNVDAVKALANIIQGLSKCQPAGAPPIVPPNEVVIIESPSPVRPTDAMLTIDQDKPVDLKPGADGKIISPFFKLKGKK